MCRRPPALRLRRDAAVAYGIRSSHHNAFVQGRRDMSDTYVMGHDDRERRRLVLQASILDPITEQLFRRAGISSGMNVLDIGCGVGDVSFYSPPDWSGGMAA